MTGIDDKPTITILFSIGLANTTNRQALTELRDELRLAGYPTELDIRPPSGQFSASLEQILIVIGSGVGVPAAIFAKKYLELAAADSYNATKRTLRKLVRRRPIPELTNVSIDATVPKGQSVNVVITIDAGGKQVKNVLAEGRMTSESLRHGLTGRTATI